jgi:hypothetical protein
LLAETVARHFPDAKQTGLDVDLGFAGLRAHCRVNEVRDAGGQFSASLFVWFRGGPFGASPVLASASGYGRSVEEAIIGGACQWTCTFGPVFQSAFAGAPPSESMDVREVTVRGRRMRMYVDGIDRAISLGAPPDGAETVNRIRASRARLAGDGWLAERVLAGELLPPLASWRPTVLSVFCADHPERFVLEVKVDGNDWPPASETFVDKPKGDPDVIVALREIAVLVPVDRAPALERASLIQALAEIGTDAGRASTSWRGFAAHGGKLHAPIPEDTLAALEKDIGPLPDDYRAFVRDVAAAGAGPGYGLLRPDHPEQRRLAQGEFPYAEDTENAKDPARGVLALAHGGCAVMWLLVLRGPRRGEVWVDAGGSDRGMRRVAAAFDDWYRAWLHACARDDFPWLHWDSGCCSMPSVLSQFLQSVEEKEGLQGEAALARLRSSIKPGGLSILSGGGPYFAVRDPLDPCAGCVALVTRLGLAESLFLAGKPPLQGRPATKVPGFFSRILGKA